MKIEIREQKILSLLESRGEMSASDLSKILGISVSTLRKQLAVMQEKKLVIRTYGGVMSVNQYADESFESKIHKAVIEKRRIANKARTLIGDDKSISLGSGTTVYALCNILDDLEGVSIYTNSMQSAEYLALCGSLDVHICGGIIRAATGTIIGNEAYEFFMSRGFREAKGFAPSTTASSKYAYLVSPSGFIIDVCQHIKKEDQ